MKKRELWHKELKKWTKQGKPKNLPPCPNCNGKMKAWDMWLVTGETCQDCGWGDSEGLVV